MFLIMTMTKEYQKKKEQRNTFLEVYVVIGVGIGKKKNGRNELVLNNNVSIKMQKKDKNPPWNSLRCHRCRFWQPKKS